jgi:hypothetical protein
MTLSTDGSPPADSTAPAAPASTEPADEPVNLEALSQEPVEAAAEEVEAEEELDDLEYEPGKKLRVPKAVKEGWLRQADYTRKTQTAADERRALDTDRETFRQQAATVQQHIETVADLRSVDRQLQDYANVDWQTYWRQNPVEAGAAQAAFNALRDQKQSLVGKLQETEQARSREAQQATARRIEETRQFAAKNIKGWNDQLDAEITQHALSLGFTDDQLRSALSPQTYRLMHLAWLGSKASTKPQTSTTAQPQAAPIAPLTTVARAGSTPSSKKSIYDPNLSMEDYASIRNAQEAAKKR